MRRAKIFMKGEKRGRNATSSNTARVPLTALTFNKIRGGGGLFIRNSYHFGMNEIYRSVSNHVGLLFLRSNHGMSVLKSKLVRLKLFHQRILLLYIRS